MVKSPGPQPPAPIPLSNDKKLPMPPVYAALGMAASYYAYPFLFSAWPAKAQYLLMSLLFLFVVIISFLRVLRRNFTDGIVPACVNKAGILAAAAAVGFSLGIASRRAVPGPAETGLPAESVIAVFGRLREDPRSLYSGWGFGILELRECSGADGLRATAWGNLVVFFPPESIPRLKEFGRGCEIYTEGIFSKGRLGPLFNASSVHIVKPAPPLDAFRTRLRTALLERFMSRQGFSPVWAGFASALLLGIRDDLDVDFFEGFRNSGCSHILALSGMHLAILSGLLAFLFRRPLGIRRASLLGSFFIVFYVFVAGCQPSLVRAAIMYLIGTFTVWGLLKAEPLSLLCMAFIIQLLFQSETGISVSFIFSYLALAGILTLGESLRRLFRGRLPEIINGGLSASLGAFVFTSPVVVLYFGTLRPIGIIAGLFLAPLSSVFMIFALAALAASFLPIPFWNFTEFFLSRIYSLIEFLISIAGRIPGLSFSKPLPVLLISIFLWLLVKSIEKQDLRHRKSIDGFR